MAEKEGLKWHDSLTAIGTVIALILGGVTFYYQFVRKTEDLRAVVLPTSIWSNHRKITLRFAIWNDGTRDEVIEAVSLSSTYTGYRTLRRAEQLFGPEIVKPGEAKAFTITADEIPDPVFFQRIPSAAGALPPIGGKVTLALEVRTINRDGGVILSRAAAGELTVKNGKYDSAQEVKVSKRLNLLTQEPLDEP